MERGDRHAPGGADPDERAVDGLAVRDAAAILARVAADEAAADQARERYRIEPMLPITPDLRVAAMLEPGEEVFATRSSTVVEWHGARPDRDASGPLAGDLFLTSRRLLLVGPARLTIPLDEVEEAVLSGERLLLTLREGRGVSLQVARPRMLRVDIAAVRAGMRA